MALVVEDGTGMANADAFVSLADADTYHAALGNNAWTGADKEAAIRRATSFLSTAYKFVGSRSNGRDQSLAWPRYGVADLDGNTVAKTEMPIEIVRATCEAALYELGEPNGLNVTVVMTDRVKREELGPLKVEYASAPTNAESAKPVLTKLENLIAPFIVGQKTGGGTNYLVRG